MDIEKETAVKGMYGNIGTWYGYPYSPVERLCPPIAPAENLRRYMAGERYEWIPDLTSDQVDLTPECIPDVVACGFAGGLDAFGVKWIPDEAAPDLPSFVEPGFTVLDEIAKWRDLEFPDVDSWDWETCGKEYREFYADDDRLLRGIILSGFFERLISIMGFQNAALSLITEPDEVAAFFDALADVNCRIVDHYVDDFGCGAIMLHDDWSAQRSPFFSPDVATELLVPAMGKVVEHAHARGAIFTHHSCGNGVALIPAIMASGADGWQAQVDAFDLEAACEAIGDSFALEIYPPVPDEVTPDTLDAYLGQMLSHADGHRFLCEFGDFDPERAPKTRIANYRISRIKALEAQRA